MYPRSRNITRASWTNNGVRCTVGARTGEGFPEPPVVLSLVGGVVGTGAGDVGVTDLEGISCMAP